MSEPAPRLAVIILAAGESRRLGRAKQLLSWQGQTLVEHAVARAETLSNNGIVLVTGAVSAQVAGAVSATSATVVVNKNWSAGMAASLRTGLAAVAADSDGVLVLLCDQPMVTTTDLLRLLDVWHNQPAFPVAATYNGVCGVPAIFPRHLFPELAGLEGEQGAGAWLRQHETLRTVEMPNAAFDIDTEEDLRKLRTRDQAN